MSIKGVCSVTTRYIPKSFLQNRIEHMEMFDLKEVILTKKCTSPVHRVSVGNYNHESLNWFAKSLDITLKVEK